MRYDPAMRLGVRLAAGVSLVSLGVVGCGQLLGFGNDEEEPSQTIAAADGGGDERAPDAAGTTSEDASAADVVETIDSDTFEDASITTDGAGVFKTRVATFESNVLVSPTDGVDTQTGMELTGKAGSLVPSNSARTTPDGDVELHFDIPSLDAIDVMFAFRIDALPSAGKVVILRIDAKVTTPAPPSLVLVLDNTGGLTLAPTGMPTGAVPVATKLPAGSARKMFLRVDPIGGTTQFALTTGAKPTVQELQSIGWASSGPITGVSVGRYVPAPINGSKGILTFDDFGVAPPKAFVK